MASKKEIKKELHIALKEIGEIKPVFDKRFNRWMFSHELYPVEYDGETPEEVIKNYPLYLEEFIKHRLDNNLSPLVEQETKGRGGYRPGAGRPKGTIGEPKIRVSLPVPIANWLKIPENLKWLQSKEHIREVEKLMQLHC